MFRFIPILCLLGALPGVALADTDIMLPNGGKLEIMAEKTVMALDEEQTITFRATDNDGAPQSLMEIVVHVNGKDKGFFIGEGASADMESAKLATGHTGTAKITFHSPLTLGVSKITAEFFYLDKNGKRTSARAELEIYVGDAYILKFRTVYSYQDNHWKQDGEVTAEIPLAEFSDAEARLPVEDRTRTFYYGKAPLAYTRYTASYASGSCSLKSSVPTVGMMHAMLEIRAEPGKAPQLILHYQDVGMLSEKSVIACRSGSNTSTREDTSTRWAWLYDDHHESDYDSEVGYGIPGYRIDQWDTVLGLTSARKEIRISDSKGQETTVVEILRKTH